MLFNLTKLCIITGSRRSVHAPSSTNLYHHRRHHHRCHHHHRRPLVSWLVSHGDVATLRHSETGRTRAAGECQQTSRWDPPWQTTRAVRLCVRVLLAMQTCQSMQLMPLVVMSSTPTRYFQWSPFIRLVGAVSARVGVAEVIASPPLLFSLWPFCS